jgi:hypothetical protein
LNITRKFLYCNHQVHRDVLLTLYIKYRGVRPSFRLYIYLSLSPPSSKNDAELEDVLNTIKSSSAGTTPGKLQIFLFRKFCTSLPRTKSRDSIITHEKSAVFCAASTHNFGKPKMWLLFFHPSVTFFVLWKLII